MTKKDKYYQGYFSPRNPKKYRGDPTNIIYRSGWELNFMNYLDKNSSVLEWSSEEIIVPYKSPVDGRFHRYFVDFFMRYRDKKGNIRNALVEIKPFKQTQEPVKKKRKTKAYINEVVTYGVNSAKWKAAQEYCADRKWEFQLFTEKELGNLV